MGYDILGGRNGSWHCHQSDWRYYLDVAKAFGWVPQGAFFKCDEGGYGEHPSGSYLGNDWQIATDDDAHALAVALNLAVATVNTGSPMTDEQAAALKGEGNDGVTVRGMTDLAKLAGAGGFTIA